MIRTVALCACFAAAIGLSACASSVERSGAIFGSGSDLDYGVLPAQGNALATINAPSADSTGAMGSANATTTGVTTEGVVVAPSNDVSRLATEDAPPAGEPVPLPPAEGASNGMPAPYTETVPMPSESIPYSEPVPVVPYTPTPAPYYAPAPVVPYSPAPATGYASAYPATPYATPMAQPYVTPAPIAGTTIMRSDRGVAPRTSPAAACGACKKKTCCKKKPVCACKSCCDKWYVEGAFEISPGIGGSITVGKEIGTYFGATTSLEVSTTYQDLWEEILEEPETGKFWALRLGAKFAFGNKNSAFRPFVRAGATLFEFTGEPIRISWDTVSVDNDGSYLGAYAGIGFDWFITDNISTGPEVAFVYGTNISHGGDDASFPMLKWHVTWHF